MEEKSNSQKIKEALDSRPQIWLHEKTGINKSDLSLICRDILVPSKDQADRIKSALGIELNYYTKSNK